MPAAVNIAAAALMIVLAGCPTPRAVPPAAPSGEADGGGEPISPREPAAQGTLLTDEWTASYISDEKVGHDHLTVRRVDADGGDVLMIEMEGEMTIERFGQPTTQRLSITAEETPEGELLRFTSTIHGDTGRQVTEGVVNDGKLRLTTKAAGREVTQDIDWEPSYGGFMAVDRAVRNPPLTAGDTREVTALVPGVNVLATAKIEAVGREKTGLLEGERELLKVRSTIVLPGVELVTLHWADESGEIWKARQVGMGIETYRTTKEIALRPARAFNLDRFTIPVDRRPQADDLHNASKVVYRARLKEGDPERAFAAGGSQSLNKLDDQTVEITVHRIRPDDPPAGDEEPSPPGEAERAPNSLIESDDAEVIKLADSIAPEESDPWRLALALERRVHEVITSKNFSEAFASAAQVARHREGDCTEHAVLLAAVCRARGIPSRVAIGLVYFPPPGGERGEFAYHMWTEVWIDGRWIPIDATLARQGIGGGHIKLTQSSLQGASPFTAFLPVVNVLNNLELEIVKIGE